MIKVGNVVLFPRPVQGPHGTNERGAKKKVVQDDEVNRLAPRNQVSLKREEKERKAWEWRHVCTTTGHRFILLSVCCGQGTVGGFMEEMMMGQHAEAWEAQ